MYYLTERYRTEHHGRRRSFDRIEWIVIHYTGIAVSALQNARALEKPLEHPRSTHYFVDGNQVVAVVREERAAWHVGGKDPSKKIDVYNGNSIGVDLCEDKLVYDRKHKSVEDRDWYFTEETEETAAELVAEIMKRHGISLDHVVRHYDVTGKWCPRPFMGDDINTAYKESGNQRWRKFIEKVKRHAGEV